MLFPSPLEGERVRVRVFPTVNRNPCNQVRRSISLHLWIPFAGNWPGCCSPSRLASALLHNGSLSRKRGSV